MLEMEGGVYLDTDVVFVHPLPGGSAASAVGIESGAGGAPGRSQEHLTTGGNGGGGGNGGAGGNGGGGGDGGGGGGASWSEGAVLCNAVMAFEAGAPFVRRALRSFVTDYVPLSPGLSFEVRPPNYHPYPRPLLR